MKKAVGRPTRRFGPVKSQRYGAEDARAPGAPALRTINAFRVHLGGLGIVAGTGVAKVAGLVAMMRDAEDDRLPAAARLALTSLADQINRLMAEVEGVAVALANKLARMVFALLTRGGEYRRPEWVKGMAPAA